MSIRLEKKNIYFAGVATALLSEERWRRTMTDHIFSYRNTLTVFLFQRCRKSIISMRKLNNVAQRGGRRGAARSPATRSWWCRRIPSLSAVQVPDGRYAGHVPNPIKETQAESRPPSPRLTPPPTHTHASHCDREQKPHGSRTEWNIARKCAIYSGNIGPTARRRFDKTGANPVSLSFGWFVHLSSSNSPAPRLIGPCVVIATLSLFSLTEWSVERNGNVRRFTAQWISFSSFTDV